MTPAPVAETMETGGVHVMMTLAVPPRRQKAEKPQEHGGTPFPSSRPRIPRITHLMALAIKFQGMLDCGVVRDYADLARLGCVTRARVTQIMNLLLLAPDLQEEIVGFAGADEQAIRPERHVRSIVKFVLWDHQRSVWSRTRRPTFV
jgi:hypothetical protein